MGTVSFFTLLSRITGFVRDVVIAHGFGAGMAADAFFVAQKLPNFLRRLFAEGAFSTAFVPVLGGYVARGEQEEVQEVVQSVYSVLLAILVLVVLIAQIAMPLLIMILAPGFMADGEKFQLTVDLTRITFPYILFIALVSLAAGVQNTYRHFALPAFTPVLLNISIMVGAFGIAPLFAEPTMGLAFGIFLGGVTQLALQYPAMKKLGVPLRWRWNPRHEAIGRILKLMGPSVLGVSVAQIGLLFDLFIASFLPQGSVSYLYYADRLVEFPLGIIGIAMATAILPTLTARAAKEDMPGLRSDLDFALRIMVLINLPATAGLIILGEPLLTMLFQRGAFSEEATALTYQAMVAFGMGLIGFSGVKILAPAFYALHDTKTPVKIAILCLATNMGLNLLLMGSMKHVGLALATTLAAYLNAGLLLWNLSRRIDFHPGRGFYSALWRAMVATGIMGGGLWWFKGWIPLDSGTWAIARMLLPAVAVAMILYGASCWILRVAELRELMAALAKRRKS
ncbi:MAG: murein biosynthesis integral membrane protein MurJ [Magnetococcales bacterium]|nr:murein biosynthesis integral membrane protein MurJ [Magnetococcales bacterium]NGZ27334.1 murein biosynthesis integral membrane protein MurJ [Magnetococcales bacterium]